VKKNHLKLLIILAILAVVFTGSVQAAVYKCVGQNGRSTFSDSPCGDQAEKIEIRSVNQMKPPKEPAAPTNTQTGTAVVSMFEGNSTVRLITKTMYCFRGLTTWQGPYLVLPSGLKVPFTKIKSISNKLSADKKIVTMNITTFDGESTSERFMKPWLKIAGDNALGRFDKQVNKISSITFAQ